MAHKLNNNILYIVLFGIFATIFVSCSDDDVPSVDLRNLCQSIPSKQVKLTMNGEVIDYAGDVAFAFPDLQLPEEEVFESKMLMEILPLWPNGSLSSPLKNTYFDINATSSPDRIIFTGKVQDNALYHLNVEGCYENDTLKLNLNYQAGVTELIGNTYNLELNADALILQLGIRHETVDWNGEQIPTEAFIRESLKPIFNRFVEKTGYDAAQITFMEDGTMKLSFRDAQNKTFVPASGHYAYRFHDSSFGCFEVGQEEALLFSKAFLPYSSSLPNGLFWYTNRNNAFIPVYYQSYEDELFMTLHLKDSSILQRFLSEWTMNISDDSEEVRRLRKVNSLFYDESVKGLIMVNMKKQ